MLLDLARVQDKIGGWVVVVGWWWVGSREGSPQRVGLLLFKRATQQARLALEEPLDAALCRRRDTKGMATAEPQHCRAAAAEQTIAIGVLATKPCNFNLPLSCSDKCSCIGRGPLLLTPPLDSQEGSPRRLKDNQEGSPRRLKEKERIDRRLPSRLICL